MKTYAFKSPWSELASKNEYESKKYHHQKVLSFFVPSRSDENNFSNA